MDPWIIIFMIAVGVIAIGLLAAVVIILANSNTTKKVDDKLKANGFIITRSAGALRIDDKNKKWCINNSRGLPVIYDFSDVADYKIEESLSGYDVKKLGVHINTVSNNTLYISLIAAEVSCDSNLYKKQRDVCNQMLEILNTIKPSQSPTEHSENAPSADDIAEQLKKFKEMADSGIITQDDYEAKKKQLLGL